MPSITLKYKSPEFADNLEKPESHNCEMPGCPQDADHKAPKHRGLNEYYHFCVKHVMEYNKAWNFFSGMSDGEVQNHMKSSRYGDRPTWKQSDGKDPEEELLKAAKRAYFYGEEQEQKKEHAHKRAFKGDVNTPEHEAMALMGLSPPVTLDEIKKQYKILAKKFHPDLNRDNPEAEDKIKKINMAYTILKLAFDEYKNLPD